MYFMHMSIKLLYLHYKAAQEKTKLVPNFNISLVIHYLVFHCGCTDKHGFTFACALEELKGSKVFTQLQCRPRVIRCLHLSSPSEYSVEISSNELCFASI